MKRIVAMISLVGLFNVSVATYAHAEELPAATGKPILVVSGKIKNTNSEGPDGPVAEFDRAMLEQLGFEAIKTTTDWTDGVKVFEGPLVRAILERVDAEGSAVEAVAINDYRVTIGNQDFVQYSVILAATMDGKRLSRRDKGPLWIVYPRDDYKELAVPEVNTRWVWQLKELHVR